MHTYAKKFCHTQVLRFFVRAIRYQFVIIVLGRIRLLIEYARIIESAFGFTLNLVSDSVKKCIRITNPNVDLDSVKHILNKINNCKSTAADAMLDFWNYKVLTAGRIISVELRHHAKFRGDWSNRCWDISIFFQDGGSHNLGYLKFYIFNDPNGQEGRTASLCQILSKSLKPHRRYASFRFFKMAAAAILDFPNFTSLTIGTVKRVELHRRAKFCRNRPNRGWDRVIYRFLKMAAVRHLGFVMRVWGPPTNDIWWLIFITVQQNLVGIDVRISISRVWLENAYSRPKIVFFVFFDPLNEEQCEKSPKRHILSRVRVV